MLSAIDDDDPTIVEPGVEGEVESRKTGRLAEPRSWRTGWRTPPSASTDAAGDASAASSRRIVPAAAALAGQTGFARYAARSFRVMPTTSARNVARAPSRSPRRKPLGESSLQPRRVVRDTRRRRSALVGHDAPDRVRSAWRHRARTDHRTSARSRRRDDPRSPQAPPRRPRRPRIRARWSRGACRPDAPRPRRSIA